MIASYLRARRCAAFEDIGARSQAELFEREADRIGRAPPVIDAADVLADPAACSAALRRLGITFDPAMLHWPAGRRETDGIWAAHWYRSVEASTGFGAPEGGAMALEGEAARLADRCRTYYECLSAYRLSA